MELGAGNTYLEVDLKEVKNNLIKIRAHIGETCEVMPVLKANAAGMGLERMGLVMTKECGVKAVAVAQVYEALRLRKAGVKSVILVMGGIPYHNIVAAVDNNVQMPVYNKEFAGLANEEAIKRGKKAMLQIKIETGMNRIGVKPGKDLEELLHCIEGLKGIKITGIFTHLVESEAADKKFSLRQHDLFKEALKQTRHRGITPKYTHVCNSAATVWFKEAYHTHVRPGRLLYGTDPNEEIDNRLSLKFPVTWYAFVTNIKEIKPGETLGYKRFYKAKRPMKVASVSFGYGDGYNRNLVFKGGYVLINGQRAHLLDMCMDQTFVDVTAIKDVKLNDKAILLGRDGNEEINLLSFARMLGSGYVNAMSTIAERVIRKYV